MKKRPDPYFVFVGISLEGASRLKSAPNITLQGHGTIKTDGSRVCTGALLFVPNIVGRYAIVSDHDVSLAISILGWRDWTATIYESRSDPYWNDSLRVVLREKHTQKDGDTMNPAKRMCGTFVLLDFDCKNSPINDGAVTLVMQKDGLHPVTQDEFAHLPELLRAKPSIPIVAFGNIAYGPSENGRFPGVPYLDTDGEVKVIENWTRGSTGDVWEGPWEFIFSPASL